MRAKRKKNKLCIGGHYTLEANEVRTHVEKQGKVIHYIGRQHVTYQRIIRKKKPPMKSGLRMSVSMRLCLFITLQRGMDHPSMIFHEQVNPVQEPMLHHG